MVFVGLGHDLLVFIQVADQHRICDLDAVLGIGEQQGALALVGVERAVDCLEVRRAAQFVAFVAQVLSQRLRFGQNQRPVGLHGCQVDFGVRADEDGRGACGQGCFEHDEGCFVGQE